MVVDSPFGPRFAVRRRLGEGGFGVVYEALDRERGHPVALKALRRLDPSALYKFKQEFRSLVDMSHPNLISLHELFSQGERWFYTMELIQGQDALAWVRGAAPSGQSPTWDAQRALDTTRVAPQTTLPEPPAERPALGAPLRTWPGDTDETRLRDVLVQLGSGLCFLHDAGKLHRDIKPSNMLVTTDGRLVLLDFGLVREVGEGSGQSNDAIVGTPGYMSPEQAVSRPLGPPSDWYSVGVFLFETLTGRLPFEGSWLQVLAQQQRHRAPSPGSLVLGIPPDLEELCRDLLATAPEDRPTGQEVLRRLGRRTAPRPSSPPLAFRRGELVGRAGALQALEEAFQPIQAQAGRSVTVLLHGPAGVGRSTLLRHFADRADAVVLSGRCYQQEAVPYKALDGVVDALSRYLRRLPRHEAQALLPREAPALQRLFPVLGRVDAVSQAPRPPQDVADQQELRRRAFDALRELLGRLADRRPLVLLIDDLQWGDADSAALLGQLLQPPGTPAMLFVASYRSEEADGNACLQVLRQVLGPPSPDGPVREVVLSPLGPEEAEALARRLLREHLGDEAVPWARALAEESGGQPAVIEELAAYQALAGARRAPGRVTLEQTIGGRLDSLPAAGRRLLEVVAVAGRPLPRALAAQAAQLGAEEPQLVSQLRGGRLLRLRSRGEHEELEPYHNRVGEAVRRRLEADGEALRAAHLRLARALEASCAEAEATALHFEAAGEAAAAARHAVRAAEQAEGALAFERAARLYRVALGHPPDGDAAQQLRLRLAEALRNAGRGAEAACAYLKAAPAVSAPASSELRRLAAEQYLHSGHIAEGLGVLRQILREVGLRMPERPVHALLRLLLLRTWLWLRGLRFRERSAAAVPRTDLLRLDTCWSAASGLANKDTIRGAYFGALHLLLALRAGEPRRLLRALALEVSYSALSGGPRPGRMERLAHRGLLELAGRMADAYAQGVVPLYGGVAAVLRGRWREGLVELDRAAEIFRDHTSGTAWERDGATHFSLLCLGVLGRLRELRRRLPGALADARQRGDLYAEVTVRTRVGHLPHLSDDRPEDAEREVRGALAAWSQGGTLGFHIQHYFGLVSLGEVALYAERGVGSGALRILEAEWAALERSRLLHAQSIRGDGVALRARALLAAAADGSLPAKEQRRRLRQAARLGRALRRERMPWITAKADLLLAGVEVLRGRPERAQSLLRAATAGFAGSGMDLFLQAARYRLGQFLGGAEGRELREAAEAALRGQDIHDPARMVAMLAPGRWPGSG